MAPLRGVTIRCFRETFAEAIREAGFDEAVTPFVSANPGVDPMRDRELKGGPSGALRVTPQFIGKDPDALRRCLERVKEAGYATADLNCGCPFPMVRRKGRGSGILRTPDVLDRMLAVGCEVMGPGRFSMKARLGIDCGDELLRLMPIVNSHPLRFLAVHARTARQMYEGACDWDAVARIEDASDVPVVRNGDLPLSAKDGMVGRAFIRAIGERADVGALLDRYIESSMAELCGERPVIGRLKELISYWRDIPRWRRLWPVVKMARSVAELRVW
ncbi:MAG: tRNA-dihydrouridine synthase family protein [Kiritimatiellae bacterium]|nr:tRNA-dihydrouridine synthase family protein [Kiritimatiellia bacterium]